jgi:hypothetical protein
MSSFCPASTPHKFRSNTARALFRQAKIQVMLIDGASSLKGGRNAVGMAYRGLSRRLMNKSVEAYVMGLETINRVSIAYRIEASAYLVCNAWELLLKAKISHDSGRNAIYYPKRRGERPRTICLRDCLRRVFLNENDPIRRNLEHLADLRDESVHLVISRIPREILGLFQACVINYNTHLLAWTGVSLSDRVPVGMMTLVYDFNPEEHDLNNPVMRRRLGKSAVRYLAQLQAAIRADAQKLGNPPEFAIGVEYHLALTKKPGEADVVLTSGPGDGGASTHVVEVAKDPSKTHPLRLKEVRAEAATKTGLALNQYDFQCVIKAHAVKKRAEFYYKGAVPGSPAQYSREFVNWMAKQCENDPDFFIKARARASSKRASAPVPAQSALSHPQPVVIPAA